MHTVVDPRPCRLKYNPWLQPGCSVDIVLQLEPFCHKQTQTWVPVIDTSKVVNGPRTWSNNSFSRTTKRRAEAKLIVFCFSPPD
ncbi:hypothetical protein BaRGS_00014013 [Batillaria attramentaria]|uniref:Uncharacterized protein n=1 Tax=Batillaria attramentaria TaxID=370345 RepID=A0ABD0L5D0_9CAEN